MFNRMHALHHIEMLLVDKNLHSALSCFEHLNVLIIEGNTLIHKVLADSLEEFGIKSVHCAQNAYFALRLCKKIHFHIIICSFNIESDKDGFHLLEELKFNGYVKRSTVLIFLSADTGESLVNSIIELQPDDFWVKPLSPSNIKKRLSHILQVKQKLFNVYQAFDNENYSKAIYCAERHLIDTSLKVYFPVLQRLKGESLLNVRAFSDAEIFYENLLNEYQYSWCYIGYLNALLNQGRIADIKALLDTLTNRPDTRFAAHDLLAKYYIGQGKFELAYEEIKQATALAPRNIDRNKKFWDLARLNRDHIGQYKATKVIAVNAKNSIHDSPKLLLNVVRAGIDLANTLTGKSDEKILKETECYLKKLSSDNAISKELREQILVAQARLHNARHQKNKAEIIIDTHVSLKASTEIEDNLDKVKVFHELGMREEALLMLEAVKKQVSGESLTSEVISKSIALEASEREDVFFTAKELYDMATKYIEKNRLRPALSAIQKGLRLSPSNAKLAMTLLQVLLMMKNNDELFDNHKELVNESFSILDKHNFEGSKLNKVNAMKEQWQHQLT